MRTKVWDYMKNKLKKSKLHMTLIDPDKQKPSDVGYIAKSAYSAGSDAIMVGGSTGISVELLNATVKELKKHCNLPVILFPTGASTISPYADAIFFMSLLNSRDRKFLISEQMKGAIIVKKMNIEPISMGYIVFEPGMKVAEVGSAELLTENDVDKAVGYALAAQYFGMKLIYLEAGSGAHKIVPPRIIKEVKNNISVPLIVGGGIKTSDDARKVISSGADIVVTGTVIEESVNKYTILTEIIKEVKEK